ncbi:MAG: hypothetical protein IPO71_06110 [Nitrosomonas sp.]|nr:hypothetical protein [Nitrosomonas sp.]
MILFKSILAQSNLLWHFYRHNLATFAPFSVYYSETNCKRRKIIASIGIAGVGLATYTIVGLAKQPIVAEIINYSINYKHDVSGYQLVIVFYLLATCVPFIFSSYKLYIAGILITIGFFVAYLTFLQTFCFGLVSSQPYQAR